MYSLAPVCSEASAYAAALASATASKHAHLELLQFCAYLRSASLERYRITPFSCLHRFPESCSSCCCSTVFGQTPSTQQPTIPDVSSYMFRHDCDTCCPLHGPWPYGSCQNTQIGEVVNFWSGPGFLEHEQLSRFAKHDTRKCAKHASRHLQRSRPLKGVRGYVSVVSHAIRQTDRYHRFLPSFQRITNC